MAGDDVLTEGEIDALMESVDDDASTGGAEDDGEFRRFDFGDREHSILRGFTALGPLLERQADILGASLEKAFSIAFNARAQGATLITVADALAALESSVAVTNITLAPLTGPVFTTCPAPLLSFIVNAYFGGGMGKPEGGEREALKASELHLAERVADLTFGSLVQSWTDKLPLEVTGSKTLDVADRLEMLPRKEKLVRLGYELVAGELSTQIQILIPFTALEPYRARFAPPSKKDGVEESESWEPYFRRELPVIRVEVAGVLAERSMSIAELTALEKGMVIPLAPPEDVRLQIGETSLGTGRYGSFEGTRAVQLQRLGKRTDAGR